MMGKQLINKIVQPVTIFIFGAFAILFLISFFVLMHISSIKRTEEIYIELDEISYLQFQKIIEEDYSADSLGELELKINNLFDSENIKNLIRAYSELSSIIYKMEILQREDLKKSYNQINSIEMILYEKSSLREESFRILLLFIFFTIIFMILFLGISQYESYKDLRNDKIRNNINFKLYDQLEKERSLIAFELHDDIAQKLAIIKRYFKSKNSIDEHTELMENYASDVIKRVRYLSRMLKAPDNPDVSFKDYLETLFSDFNVLSDFKLNRKTVGLNALKLNPSAALHIYRIIQEILTNSRIHSEATEIDLLLVYSHPTLNIKYKDNGKGFDPYLVYRKGIGLESIKYRLDILRGEYTLNSLEGEGTDISIDIPVELCEIS